MDQHPALTHPISTAPEYQRIQGTTGFKEEHLTTKAGDFERSVGVIFSKNEQGT